MSIYSVLSSFYPGYEKTSTAKKAFEKQDASGWSVSGKRVSKKRDSVEISLDAYEMQTKDGQMHASSGKDTLGISKGDGEGSFVIHFSDSAMVSRAIARGYITVNGIEIPLSDDKKSSWQQLKKRLRQTGEHAGEEVSWSDFILKNRIKYAQGSSSMEN